MCINDPECETFGCKKGKVGKKWKGKDRRGKSGTVSAGRWSWH